MAGYPEIQEKVYQEIEQALGSEKEASYEDRSKLPYTEATMHEVLRFSAAFTLGYFHPRQIFYLSSPSSSFCKSFVGDIV